MRPDQGLDMWLVATLRLEAAPLDGSAYAGLSFRLRLAGTGDQVSLSIEERSAAGSESWRYGFTDDQAGWRTIEIPWSALERGVNFQPPDAANDGFSPRVITILNFGVGRTWSQGPAPVALDLAEVRFLPALDQGAQNSRK